MGMRARTGVRVNPKPSVITVAATGDMYRVYPDDNCAITRASLDRAYAKAGIDGDADAHTLTVSGCVDIVGGDNTPIAGTALTEVQFRKRKKGLRIKGNAFNGVEDLVTVTFGAVSGNLSIGNSAFAGVGTAGALTTVTFGVVGRNLTIGANAYLGHEFTNAVGSDKGVRFPSTYSVI